MSSIREGKGLPRHRVTSLLEDHAGHLWVGIDDGLFVYKEQKFRAVRRRDGTPIGAAIAMIEDRDHNIWRMPSETLPASFEFKISKSERNFLRHKCPRLLPPPPILKMVFGQVWSMAIWRIIAPANWTSSLSRTASLSGCARFL